MSLERPQSPELQEDVKSVVNDLNQMVSVLGPGFSPVQRTAVEINRLFSNISAYAAVINAPSRGESNALMKAARNVEGLIPAALAVTNAQISRESPDLGSAAKEIRFWLQEQAPTIIGNVRSASSILE